MLTILSYGLNTTLYVYSVSRYVCLLFVAVQCSTKVHNRTWTIETITLMPSSEQSENGGNVSERDWPVLLNILEMCVVALL